MEVKGTVIHTIPKSILNIYGPYGLKRWLELISPDARRVYSSEVDIEAWYPLKKILIEPTANIAQLFFDWDLKAAAWEFGRISAEARFKGLLKIAVKIGSPNFFVNKAGEYLHRPEIGSIDRQHPQQWYQGYERSREGKNLEIPGAIGCSSPPRYHEHGRQ